MEFDTMYSYAQEYAKLGFAIFPLKERDKTPIINHWNTQATSDAAIIKAWWQKFPNANIGIATGQISGGLYVIDMDCHNEGVDGYQALKDWQKTHGVIPPSWMAITGSGGYHYFFRDKEEHKNRAGIIAGVDFRGDGGYIVAPPSIHPSGDRYVWHDKLSPEMTDLATCNNTLKYFINLGKNVPQMTYTAPEKIPQGERNAMLFKFACMMQSKGASDQAVYAATQAEMESKCTDWLSEKELQQIVKSALKYEKGKQIYIYNDGTAIQGQREPIFEVNAKGLIKRTWDNIREAIEFDPMLYSHIRYNELANSIFVYGTLPWEQDNTYRSWNNTDDANLKSYLEKSYGFNSTEKIMDALSIVANKYKFNPIVDELEKIHNEYGACEGSIRKLLPEYMGCEDSDYNYEVMRLYMLGAISRVYHAGCKFDYSLILYGTQGFGKSEFLRHLAIYSEWFNDNFATFEGDKAIEKLAGMWIIEMAELKALKSSRDAETFKAFLTSRVDTYRAPYSRRSEQRPRMCVFAGTTNNKNVFVDKTGNRRFLPVITRKGHQSKDLFGDQDAVMEDFKKAWAEAMEIFLKANKEPKLILSREAQLVAEHMQEEFSEEDYRVGIIQEWLDQTVQQRVCVPMIIEYALNVDLEKMSAQHKREILEIMDNEIKNWKRIVTKDKKSKANFYKYGTQICFIKDTI